MLTSSELHSGIITASALMIVLFSFQLVAVIHNIVLYLFKQGRRQEFHIAYFYAIATTITLVRMAYFIQCVVYSSQELYD